MSRYGSNLTPASPPSKFGSKSQKSRGRREPSGVFTLFQPAQVQQFREAFSLVDQDSDGIVSEDDLKKIFASLGKVSKLSGGGVSPTADQLRILVSSRPGGHTDQSGDGVNFMEFLTLMGEHLFEFDAEAELIEAFECFDEGDTGFVKCEEIRRWMTEVGERMDAEEVDRFLRGPFTDRQGNFNYREWVKVLRINAEDESTEQNS